MKKAKITLAAITVFAVVGGALAFKATKTTTILCSTTTSDAALCTRFVHNTFSVDPENGSFYCTIDGNPKCDIQADAPVLDL